MSSQITDAFSLLHTLSKQQTQTGTQLLLKIYDNILKDPTNTKYHNLDYLKISNKFQHSDLLLHLLFVAGFYKSENNKRLFFDVSQFNQLQLVNNKLLLFTQQLTETDTISSDKVPTDIDKSKMALKATEYDTVEAKVESRTQITSCTQHISKCDCLPRLIKVNKQHKSKQIMNDENTNALSLLNDYLHLMCKHNNDKQFEYIANQFDKCDIVRCKIFQRNSRNRHKLIDINDSVICEITDKIHCYFSHSCHIGNRLSMKEKQIIDLVEEKKMNDENKSFEQYLVNKKMHKITEILCTKQQLYKQIGILNDRLNKRYNQLLFPQITSTCPNNHTLKSFITSHKDFICDYCNKNTMKNIKMWGCGVCNYGLCCVCYNNKIKVKHVAITEKKDQEQNIQFSKDNNKTYHFGFKFKYEDDFEYETESDEQEYDEYEDEYEEEYSDYDDDEYEHQDDYIATNDENGYLRQELEELEM
eukprot:434608_1